MVATDTIYPHEPQRQWDESLATLARLASAHRVELVAIGNGTASRETDKLAADLIKRHPELEPDQGRWSPRPARRSTPPRRTPRRSCPSWTCRCAARSRSPAGCRTRWPSWSRSTRKSIGVGQYQHDLSEVKLSRSLDAVVEDCVNAVGVDVNTASAPLLTRVSGHRRRAWPRTSCRTATPTARSAPARR